MKERYPKDCIILTRANKATGLAAIIGIINAKTAIEPVLDTDDPISPKLSKYIEMGS